MGRHCRSCDCSVAHRFDPVLPYKAVRGRTERLGGVTRPATKGYRRLLLEPAAGPKRALGTRRLALRARSAHDLTADRAEQRRRGGVCGYRWATWNLYRSASLVLRAPSVPPFCCRSALSATPVFRDDLENVRVIRLLIARRVAKARLDAGLSQQQVADAVGRGQGWVSETEGGSAGWKSPSSWSWRRCCGGRRRGSSGTPIRGRRSRCRSTEPSAAECENRAAGPFVVAMSARYSSYYGKYRAFLTFPAHFFFPCAKTFSHIILHNMRNTEYFSHARYP